LVGPSSDAPNHEIWPTEVKSTDVQQVDLTHLKPATTYCIRLITENGAHDGPLYWFTTSEIDVGSPYSLFGRLVEPDEITPVSQNLITVRIDRQGNRSELLSTLTDTEGFWTVNLGNLKDPESGLPYAWQVGDPIQIIAHGTGETETRDVSQQITGYSPQNTVPVYKTEIEQKRARANRFSLGQNLPNPFNPSTKIIYTIANNQAVYTTLTVFNILGQKIKTLVSRMHQPGQYEVIWDGTDSIGQEITSGVYFYRIESGPEHDTRSMILLR
ncbi:MAG: T9SS type A sorting domain-containing protein, partial [Candidatus Latescibacteria bacterium]|nr:T9SS type A sorting domain-containing protein [Candidatus Latescibacterota bacterium]